MDLIYSFVDFVLHIDKHLIEIVGNYHVWTYLLLFAIILVNRLFCRKKFIAMVIRLTMMFSVIRSVGPNIGIILRLLRVVSGLLLLHGPFIVTGKQIGRAHV